MIQPRIRIQAKPLLVREFSNWDKLPEEVMGTTFVTVFWRGADDARDNAVETDLSEWLKHRARTRIGRLILIF